MIRLIMIDNLETEALRIYSDLNENQLRHYYEPQLGLFVGESRTVVERALNAGYEPVSMLMEKRYVETEGKELLERLRLLPQEIPVYVSTVDVLSQITGYHLTRGILCAFRRRALPSVEEICRNARRIAVLENIENPTNIGAMIRSAAALNMDALLLTPACADPLYRRAIRVSVGTVFQIPWTYIGVREKIEAQDTHDIDTELTILHRTGRTMQCEQSMYTGGWPEGGMQQLHRLGFRTAAMALQHDTMEIDDPKLLAEEKLAIVLGNEGDGLARQTIASCDYTVKIPMSHGVDSLNVAAASAVAFWQLGRR